jgi:hypothetical protein
MVKSHLRDGAYFDSNSNVRMPWRTERPPRHRAARAPFHPALQGDSSMVSAANRAEADAAQWHRLPLSGRAPARSLFHSNA